MKTKITLLIGAVALVTLSFTFTSIKPSQDKSSKDVVRSNTSAPAGGIMVDEVVQ